MNSNTYELCAEQIKAAAEKYLPELIALSDDLHAHPEVSGEEFESSRKIVELLRSHGCTVEYPYAGYPTAFCAVSGKGGHSRKAAIMTEYDALPQIGHACGHNVSAAISVLAGLSLQELQDQLDCDIYVIGTPVEETDGAKCTMVKNGVFDGFDMAMMIHMYDTNLLYCKLLALQSYLYTFHGKAAHASAAPWDGINALNAAQLMMHAVDMLRQHVTPDVRMHAVYRDGGAAPNIVPESASIEYYIRALDRQYLNGLKARFDDIAKGVCLCTGATYECTPTAEPYDNLLNVPSGIEALREVYNELGVELNGDHDAIFGSSDAGNVSFVCPTFHSNLQIAPVGTPIHTREFAAAAKSPEAHQAILTGGQVIARQIAKVFTNDELLAAMKSEFMQLTAAE